MIRDNTEYRQAYSGLMKIFAELFKFPEKENHEEVISGQLDQQIRQLSALAGYEVRASIKNVTGTYEDMVQAFNNCFLGITRPFAPPVESVYKNWTEDDSFQVPYKNQKGYLLGDPALHMRHIIQAFGLEIPQEYEIIPDHLTIILELYAYLLEQGFANEAEQLKQDHLDWLDDFYDALSRVDQNQPYKAATHMLREIIRTGLNPDSER